ncbi:MAG: DoxX family membrane protein [Chloroflexi bacterium]|nr:DoxX family membrane protein [Chloroflexota bacterium]
MGGVVAMHGLMKLGLVGQGGSVAGVGAWFGSIGLRPGILWAVVAVAAEAGGGLLMALGLGGPIGPGLVAADLLVVTIVAHWPQGFWVAGGKSGWEFPVSLSAAGLAVALVGNGALSLDGAFGLTYPEGFAAAWLGLMAAGALLALIARAIFAPKASTSAS